MAPHARSVADGAAAAYSPLHCGRRECNDRAVATDALPHGLVVRDLTSTDSTAELTRLLHRAYAGLAERGLRYVASHQDEETTRRRIARGECLVATLKGQLVGTVIFTPKEKAGNCEWYQRPDVASCEQLAVDTGLWGASVGSLLLDLVEERAWQTGAREIALDTSEQADDLIGWYRRRGYRVVQEADWEVTNYRSVVLSKCLTLAGVTIRTAVDEDQSFLTSMLSESVNWDVTRPRTSLEQMLGSAQLRLYVEDWGGPGDLGTIAEDTVGAPIGAAWLRHLQADRHGYGFVRSDIPEASIAVRRPWRGHGVGDRLLAELEGAAREAGVRALSLSVERDNPALRLYRRRGYRTVASLGGSNTMLLQL